MPDAAQLIENLGRQAVAEATNAAVGTVDVWKHRRRIPRTAWPEIQKTFPDVSLDLLLEIEALAPAEPSP